MFACVGTGAAGAALNAFCTRRTNSSFARPGVMYSFRSPFLMMTTVGAWGSGKICQGC